MLMCERNVLVIVFCYKGEIIFFDVGEGMIR